MIASYPLAILGLVVVGFFIGIGIALGFGFINWISGPTEDLE